jgi:hypothetical protein
MERGHQPLVIGLITALPGLGALMLGHEDLDEDAPARVYATLVGPYDGVSISGIVPLYPDRKLTRIASRYSRSSPTDLVLIFRKASKKARIRLLYTAGVLWVATCKSEFRLGTDQTAECRQLLYFLASLFIQLDNASVMLRRDSDPGRALQTFRYTIMGGIKNAFILDFSILFGKYERLSIRCVHFSRVPLISSLTILSLPVS